MIATPITPGITDDEAWAAVLDRDRSFDGRFVTGVLSTGIYCRPSCAARHPRRANVRFFAAPAAARAAGLRACLRCAPDDISREERAVLAAIEAIRAAGQPLALGGAGRGCRLQPGAFPEAVQARGRTLADSVRAGAQDGARRGGAERGRAGDRRGL